MDDELEFTSKQTEQDNVAGISRSGRLRKKSMKLRDFESLDDVDSSGRSSNPGVGASSSAKVTSTGRSVTVGNAAVAGLTSPARFTPKQPLLIKEEISSEEELFDATMYTVKSEYEPIKQETCSEIENEHDMNVTQNDESSLDSTGSEFDELDESVHQDKDMEEDGFQAIGSADYASPAAAQSIYLLEKSPVQKKLVIKDGEINEKAKTQRKDKVPPRVTSYMLWSKNIRQELIKKNPEWDFSQTRKRLGELWATIPYDEKYIWKRRAIRLATKAVTNKTSAGPLTSPTTVVTTGCVQQQQQQRRDVSPPIKRLKFPPGTSRKSPGSGAVVVKNQLVPSPAALNSRDKHGLNLVQVEESANEMNNFGPHQNGPRLDEIRDELRRLTHDLERGYSLLTTLRDLSSAPASRTLLAAEFETWINSLVIHVRFISGLAREDGPAPVEPRNDAKPLAVMQMSALPSPQNQSVTVRINPELSPETRSGLSRVTPPTADTVVDPTSPAPFDLSEVSSVLEMPELSAKVTPALMGGGDPRAPIPSVSDGEKGCVPEEANDREPPAKKPRSSLAVCPICTETRRCRVTTMCRSCERVRKLYADRKYDHYAACAPGPNAVFNPKCKVCVGEKILRLRGPAEDGKTE